MAKSGGNSGYVTRGGHNKEKHKRNTVSFNQGSEVEKCSWVEENNTNSCNNIFYSLILPFHFFFLFYTFILLVIIYLIRSYSLIGFTLLIFVNLSGPLVYTIALKRSPNLTHFSSTPSGAIPTKLKMLFEISSYMTDVKIKIKQEKGQICGYWPWRPWKTILKRQNS